jgi:rubrerythrin
MEEEIIELLDSAIYKEIASEALYLAVQHKTDDPGASKLMQELAAEEKNHSQWISALKDRGTARSWHKGVVADLKISEHLTGADRLDGAGLQDTLVFAMKREQESIDFYSRLMGLMRTRSGKVLCRKLANEELRHKLKLEITYDDLFLGDD